VPLERIANRSTSLGIPDSNGGVGGSGDDVLPVGRVSNGPHSASMPHERVADLLELDALEAGRNPESITNGAGLSLGMGNLK